MLFAALCFVVVSGCDVVVPLPVELLGVGDVELEARFVVVELEAGFVVVELEEAGFVVVELEEAGFVVELEEAGFVVAAVVELAFGVVVLVVFVVFVVELGSTKINEIKQNKLMTTTNFNAMTKLGTNLKIKINSITIETKNLMTIFCCCIDFYMI